MIVFFTRNPQCDSVLGVKVKGEGRKNKLVECAMCRCVSVRAHVRVREESALSGGRFGGRLSRRGWEEECKTRAFSQESPLVFGSRNVVSRYINFFLLEISIIRNKRCTFALDKTQPSLFPSLCGVPIVQDKRAFRPRNQRKRSLTY